MDYSNADLEIRDVQFKSKNGDKNGPVVTYKIDIVFKNLVEMKKAAVERVVWSAQQIARSKGFPHDRKVTVGADGKPVMTQRDLIAQMKPEELARLKELIDERMKFASVEKPVEVERKIYTELELEDFTRSQLETVLAWYSDEETTKFKRGDLIEEILSAQELDRTTELELEDEDEGEDEDEDEDNDE